MKTTLVTLLTLLVMADPVYGQQSLVLSSTRNLLAVVSGKVVAEAYQRLGIKVHIDTFPAGRSLIMSNSGDVDGEVYRVKGMEKTYENLVMVPVAVNKVEVVVFAKDVTFSVTGWDSLKPYSIGIRRGSTFVEKKTKGMKVKPVTKIEQLFLMLDLGRNDVIVTSRLAGLKAMKELKIKGIHLLEPPLATKNVYHYLHKKNAHLLPDIKKVLQDMENEGRIKDIRKQAISELF